MSSPEHHSSSRRFAVEQSLAPHVEERWAEDLILELRLLGLSGDQIGAALSEVESHCVDSGEPAADAFGDAREYARSLGLEPREDVSGLALLRSVGPVVVEVVGMMPLLWGFTAWRRGEDLQITGGQIVGLVVLLLAIAALVRWSEAVLRLAVHRPVLLWALLMVGAGLGVASALLGSGVVATLPACWGGGVGAAAIVGGLAWAVAQHRADGTLADPVTSPFGATGPSEQRGIPSGPAASDAHPRLVRLAMHPEALVPVWTVVMLAVTWWFTR